MSNKFKKSHSCEKQIKVQCTIKQCFTYCEFETKYFRIQGNVWYNVMAWLLWGDEMQMNCWPALCYIWTLTHVYHLCCTAKHILWVLCIVVVSVIPIRCQPERQKPHIALSSCHLQVVCLAHYIPHCLIKHVPYDDMYFFVLQLLQVLQVDGMKIHCLFDINVTWAATATLVVGQDYMYHAFLQLWGINHSKVKIHWLSKVGICTNTSNKIRATNIYAIPILSFSIRSTK